MPLTKNPDTDSFQISITGDEIRTLYFIGGYIVGILICFHLPIIKHLLYPFKLIAVYFNESSNSVQVGFHEFGHASVGLMTGARIKGIRLDLNTSGCTQMSGGIAWLTLPAGYLGSSFYGGLMVFAGFNVLASKIVSIFVAFCMAITLFYASNWLARAVTVLFIAGIGLLWWVDGGVGLTYVILFLGVLTSLLSLWDLEGLMIYNNPESDAYKFSKLCGCCAPQVWGVIWFLIGLILLAFFILLALILF